MIEKGMNPQLQSYWMIVRAREVIKIVYAQRLEMNVKFEPIR